MEEKFSFKNQYKKVLIIVMSLGIVLSILSIFVFTLQWKQNMGKRIVK